MFIYETIHSKTNYSLLVMCTFPLKLSWTLWGSLAWRGGLSVPHFFFKKYILFIYFRCAGSLLLSGLFSSCGKQGFLSSCSGPAFHCGGFFRCGAQAIGHMSSIVGASWAPECRLKNCGTWASLLHAMWDLARSGIEWKVFLSGRQILSH